jgi:rhodanese-related sulfurtransferase
MSKVVFVVIFGLLLIATAGWTVGEDQAQATLLEQDSQVSWTTVAPQRVSADRLARWVLENRGDLILIDVRSAGEYSDSHISAAVHVELSDLLRLEVLRRLPSDRPIIVYSNEEQRASTAVLALRLAKFNAYFLAGGLNHWHRYTLNPTKAGDSYAELLDYTKRVDVARRLKIQASQSGSAGQGWEARASFSQQSH